jgi:hypothetical protein
MIYKRPRVSMKIVELVVLVGGFFLSTNLCGKSIGKRAWGESVMYFLFALGVILVAARNVPPF